MFGYYLDLALRSLRRQKALAALIVLAIAVVLWSRPWIAPANIHGEN